MAQLNALQKRRQSGVVTMAILLVVFTFIFYVTSSREKPVIYCFYLGDEW